MRDFHKVQEQEGFALTLQQVYLLLGGIVVAMGVVFALGYGMGKSAAPTPAPAEDPLIPPDVQNESVSQLLARAAEEEADASNQEKLELQFHSILPNRTGEQSEAPPPGAEGRAAAEAKGTGTGTGKDSNGTDTTGEASGSVVKEGADKDKAAKGAEGGAKSSSPEVDKAASKASDKGGDKASDKSAEKGATASSGATTKESVKPLSKETAKEDVKAKEAQAIARASAASSSSKPAKPATDSEAAAGSGKGFTVQVSSYQESGVADKLVRQLMAQGFSAYRVEADVNGQKWYRVRVGSFDNQDKAEKEMQRLKAARSELKPMIAHK